MKLLYFECKKVWSNKKFSIFLILTMLMNVCFLGYDIYQKNTTSIVNDKTSVSMLQFEEQQHKEEINMYPKMIEDILDESDKALHSTLFQMKNGKQNVYLKQKINVYETFKNKAIPYKNTQAVSYTIDFPISRLLLFLSVLMISYLVFMQEFETGTMRYVMALKRGRISTCLYKYCAAFCLSCATFFLLLATNFICSIVTFHEFPITAPIQLVSGFIESPLSFTIFHYILLYIIGSLFVIALFLAFLMFLSYLTKKGKYAIFLFLIFSILEISCYWLIDTNSYLAVLKNINVMNLFLFHSMYQTFVVMTIWNTIVPVSSVISILSSICILLLLIGSFLLFTNTFRLRFIKLPRLKRFYHIHSLAYYETYKFFFLQKAGLILVIFLIANIFLVKDYRPFITIDEYYYQSYSEQLNGPPSIMKDNLVKEQKEVYEINHKNIENLRVQYQEQKISEREYEIQYMEYDKIGVSEKGFMIAFQQYEQVKKQGGIYIDQSAYKELLGPASYKIYSLQFLCICILLMISLSSIMAIESTSGMNVYMNTMTYQMNKVNKRKRLIAISYGVLVFLIGMSFRFIKIFIYYKGSFLNSSVQNLLFLNTSLSIPINAYIGMWICIGTIITITLSFIYLTISKKAESEASAIFFSAFTLLPILTLYLLL